MDVCGAAASGPAGSDGPDGQRGPGHPAPGYLLAVEPSRSTPACSSGCSPTRPRVEADRPRAAAEILDQALSLWRGPALVEFADEPFAAAEAARLDELRLVAMERRFDIDLAVGAHAELVGQLRAFTALHPLRERPRGQLMLALYRCGRQAEALEAFTDVPQLLEDELGLEPSDRLRAQQAAILRQAAELDGPPLLPSSSTEARPTSSFAARTRQRRRRASSVGWTTSPRRPPGSARRGWSRSPGSAVWARRAWPGEPPPRCRASSPMASRGASWPRSPTRRRSLRRWPRRSASAVQPEAGVVDSVADFLAPKRLLLVLDNCEHVLAGSPTARRGHPARLPTRGGARDEPGEAGDER